MWPKGWWPIRINYASKRNVFISSLKALRTGLETALSMAKKLAKMTKKCQIGCCGDANRLSNL
jgi:hypothetical protein